MISTPGAMIFALLFRPVVLLRVIARLIFKLLRLLACCPCLVARVVLRRRRERRKRDAERRRSSVVKSKAVAHKLKAKSAELTSGQAGSGASKGTRRPATTPLRSVIRVQKHHVVALPAAMAPSTSAAGPLARTV